MHTSGWQALPLYRPPLSKSKTSVATEQLSERLRNSATSQRILQIQPSGGRICIRPVGKRYHFIVLRFQSRRLGKFAGKYVSVDNPTESVTAAALEVVHVVTRGELSSSLLLYKGSDI
jgi:hypothetical protein